MSVHTQDDACGCSQCEHVRLLKELAEAREWMRRARPVLRIVKATGKIGNRGLNNAERELLAALLAEAGDGGEVPDA